MAQTKAPEPIQIALRVTSDIVDRADALVATALKNPKLAVGRVTRSSLLKLALVRGLEVLEEELR